MNDTQRKSVERVIRLNQRINSMIGELQQRITRCLEQHNTTFSRCPVCQSDYAPSRIRRQRLEQASWNAMANWTPQQLQLWEDATCR